MPISFPRVPAVYPATLCFGLAYALWLLSWHSIFPSAPLHLAALGDEATSITGQRYFLAAPWGWRLLRAPLLGAPGGTNVGLTDSIPLALLVVKPWRWLLAPGASVAQVWLAAMLALQPVAAVFAVRAAGACRALPALAAAVLALSLPILLRRYGHMALCSHAAILLALGLYFRLVSGRVGWAAAIGLMLACVLVHPYILALVVAVLAAAPLTLLLRAEPGWLRASLLFLAGVASCFGLAWLLGYGGTVPAPGFGFYSMNLLGPLLPSHSSLFPELAVDATGGQWLEGDVYLGAGMLVLALVGLVQALRQGAGPWRRHAGLVLVLLGLTALALSNRVYAGTWLLLDGPRVPAPVQQFRATGRFFWPVTYAILVAGVVVVARSLPPRLAGLVLGAAVLLQLLDTSALRHDVYRRARRGDVWAIDAAALRPVFAAHRQLTLWPSFACGALADHPAEVQTALLASETLMRTNTVALGRERGDADCQPDRVLAQSLAPGELRVMSEPGDAWRVPDASRHCVRAGSLVLCSANVASLAALPPLAAPTLPLGMTVRAQDPVFPDLLGPGWSRLEADGVWTDSKTASLQFLRPGRGAMRLTLGGLGLAPGPAGEQVVDVQVDGHPGPAWHLADLQAASLELPIPDDGPSTVTITLRIETPTRPLDRGMSGDARSLGVLLQFARLETG